MSTNFVPPRPDQWQGPAKSLPPADPYSSAGFVPPSPDSWQGPAPDIPSDFQTDPGFKPSPTQRYFGRLAEDVAQTVPGTIETIKHPINAVKNIVKTPSALWNEWQSGQRPEALADVTSIAAPLAVKGIGRLMSGTAEPLAEGALGIRKIDRAYGKTPGQSALDETSGLSPDAIAASAQNKLNQLRPELERQVATSTLPASLQPAIDVIDAEITKAQQQNAAGKVSQLQALRNTLTQPVNGFAGQVDPATGQIATTQTPAMLLNLKRGFADEHVNNWNPDTMHDVRGVAGRVYGALDTELDRTVPAAQDLNQRMSSLIPVARRAESTARNADIPQRIMHRASAHTGALAAAIGGYYAGGVPGGVAGFVLPELISSPAGQMAVARALRFVGKGLDKYGAVVDAPVSQNIGQRQESIATRLGKQIWSSLGGPEIH